MTRLRHLVSRCLLVCTLTVAIVPAAHARGADSCPEPNDELQRACVVKSGERIVGFLFHANDVDAYRVEVLDWNASARVALTEAPFPYRLTVFDWAGTVVARSAPNAGTELADVKLGPPGSYFFVVDSTFGDFSDDAPYRLQVAIDYPSPPPDVLATAEFRAGATEKGDVQFDDAGFTGEGGSYVVTMRRAGTPQSIQQYLTLWGPRLNDFTLSVDTRVVGGAGQAASYGPFLPLRNSIDRAVQQRPDGGWPTEAFRGLWWVVDVGGQRIRVVRTPDASQRIALDWTPAPRLSKDQPNRLTVRYAGPNIVLFANGSELARLSDDTYADGHIGFGAFSGGQPISVRYDNVLVTRPGT
ncbi:MAG: hypothetical protein U0821_04870 [Chloroflexota bacterium]